MEEAALTTGNKAESERRHRHAHRHHHSRSSRHHEGVEDSDRHRQKRPRYSKEEDENEGHRLRRRHHHSHHRTRSRDTAREKISEETISKDASAPDTLDIPRVDRASSLKRDSWMESPSALDFDYTQKGLKKGPPSKNIPLSYTEAGIKTYQNGTNPLQQNLPNDTISENSGSDRNDQPHISYSFGDSGSSWRMTQLKSVFRIAEETGRDVDDVAEERYGSLEAFDNAREESNELDRREMYGQGYLGKDKPSGELFAERKSKNGHRDGQDENLRWNRDHSPTDVESKATPSIPTAPHLNQTELNRLKAQLMKAKLKGSADAARLEKEYNAAAENFQIKGEPNVVVLDTMANRMLVGGRQGEVKSIDNKRGRERGLVEENEDMSIEDMVREERRTRGQAGGEGQRFAERIAKDVKFDVSRHVNRPLL